MIKFEFINYPNSILTDLTLLFVYLPQLVEYYSYRHQKNENEDFNPQNYIHLTIGCPVEVLFEFVVLFLCSTFKSVEFVINTIELFVLPIKFIA